MATIFALSGFLGLPSDWNHVPIKNLTAIDWQEIRWSSLEDWGERLDNWIDRQEQLLNLPRPWILMGYSFGGRLALHSLIHNPKRWKGAVIISAHPGLQSLDEKQTRLEHDRKWAKRFDTEAWDSLIKDWNNQTVFALSAFAFERKEHNYQRSTLKKALMQGSLGSQNDLRQQIGELDLPILWMTGSNDNRFCTAAQELTFKHPSSRWLAVPEAGHRVPWEQPLLFADLVSNFILLTASWSFGKNNTCN